MSAAAAQPTQPARRARAGRARARPRHQRTLERALRVVLGGGWAASVARALGLQGRLRVAEHRIVLPSRPVGAPPLRVGFASDFHAGPTTHPSLVANACRALAAARLDLLLLGGDYVSLDARHIDELAPLLAAIPAPFGRFAVLGNHDLVADDAYIVERLERVGVRVLVNQCVRLAPPHDDVSVCALDDPLQGAPDAAAAFAGASAVRLALFHSPDGLRSIGARPFDAAFCGHTHGGQVLYPTGTPVLEPSGAVSRVLLQGRFCVGAAHDQTVLVSRGVGCSTLPVRLFAWPQVHVCELVGGAGD